MFHLRALVFISVCLLSATTAFGAATANSENIFELVRKAHTSTSPDLPWPSATSACSEAKKIQRALLQASLLLLEKAQLPEHDTLSEKGASRKALDALKNVKRMAAIVCGRTSYEIGATLLSGKRVKPDKHFRPFPGKAILKEAPYALTDPRSVAQIDALPYPPPDRRSLPGKRPGDPRASPGKLAGEKTAAVA